MGLEVVISTTEPANTTLDPRLQSSKIGKNTGKVRAIYQLVISPPSLISGNWKRKGNLSACNGENHWQI